MTRGLAWLCGKYLDYYECRSNRFEKNGEQNVLRKLRTQSLECIFDVGAHTGQWSLMAHEIFPTVPIHAFEIIPEICEVLARNLQGRDTLVINPFGLSDTNSQTTIHYGMANRPGFSSLSSLAGEPPGGRGRSVAKTVRVMTGDSYMEKHGINHINFLKIDVEGAESRVLKGLGNALANKKIDIIQFECNKLVVLSKFLLIDFYKLFDEYRYRVGKIYYDYVDFREYDHRHENFYGPNYLAVRGDRPDLIDLLS